jgi:hypothetical protein
LPACFCLLVDPLHGISTYLRACLSVCLAVYLSVSDSSIPLTEHQPTYLPACSLTCLSVCVLSFASSTKSHPACRLAFLPVCLPVCLPACLSVCLCLLHSSPLIESYPVYLVCLFLRLCPILHALDLISACLSVCLSIYLCLILRAFDYISACLSPCISALDVILPYLLFFSALLMEHQPACLPACLYLSLYSLDVILLYPFLGLGPVGSPHLSDPDSTESHSATKALVEIHSRRSFICFILSVIALFILSQVACSGLQYFAAVQLKFSPKWYTVGYLITSFVYLIICEGSFARRRSYLNESAALVRFVNNRFPPGVDDKVTPTTVKCSFWSLIICYIAAIFLTMVFLTTIWGLDLALTTQFGPLPSTVSNILYFTMYSGGCLLVTSRIFNLRTNFMIVVTIGLSVLAMYVNKSIFTIYMFVLGSATSIWLYRNYGLQTVQRSVSTSITTNASPVLLSRSGTGSILATDDAWKKLVFSDTTTVSTSNSSSSSRVPASRRGFSYSVLGDDESAHGPGDVRR